MVDIGIDLGTSSILVYIKNKGIVLKEDSVVAVDNNAKSIIAFGKYAKMMIGKTPSNVETIRPLREGVISNYTLTEEMLKYFIQKSIGKRMLIKPRIAVCVPSAVTEVEKKAIEDATKEAGARQVFVIEEPIAAAIGSGIDISRACGSMVVDIGGGTTDIAVISLGGAVVSTSLKVAGDNFDDAIIRYMRKKYNILVGDSTAEQMKINIGTAYQRSFPAFMDVKGRNLITGLPNNIRVSSEEMYDALFDPVSSIVNAVSFVLEKTPPELSSDIIERGIVITGGGGLLYGLDKLISEKTGITTVIAEESISCVVLGTGKYIEHQTKRKKINFINLFRR